MNAQEGILNELDARDSSDCAHGTAQSSDLSDKRRSGLDGIFYWPSWFGPAILFDLPTWWGGAAASGGGWGKEKEGGDFLSPYPSQGLKQYCFFGASSAHLQT